MTAQYASALAYREPELSAEQPAKTSIEELSQSALHRRFKPLFRPRPIIYWSDMLASAVIGWGGFAVFLVMGTTLPGIIGMIAAVLGMYRAVLFIHEIAHLKHRSIDAFMPVWN